MPSSRSTKKPLQKFIVIFSAIAFLGSTALMAASMFTSNQPVAPSDPQAETLAVEEQLAVEEEGFAAVIEREPDNEFALTRLVEIRLQMQKYSETIEPLQKLVELNPDNQQALQALAAVQIQTGNYEGAIAPLETLVKLNPEATELQDQLTKIKEQVNTREQGQSQSQPSQP
jgi:predicted Zn-dependent protease